MSNNPLLNFNTIPIFDLRQFLSPDKNVRAHFINELRAVCHQVGFFYIAHHGIDFNLMERMLFLAKSFFDLPQAEKETVNIMHSPHYRGYGKLGAETTLGISDYKETYDLGLEYKARAVTVDKPYLILHGPNQWPTSQALKALEWQETMLHYISLMQKLGQQLMTAMALTLHLPEDFFLKQFGNESDDAYAILRLLRYPPGKTIDGQLKPELGVGPHTDFGCLAMLLQDEVGGLQVQNCEGKWIEAPPIPNTFIINIGDMLQVWSNNYFLATPHRVINTSTFTRYSVPFFFEPNLMTQVRPLALSKTLNPNVNRPKITQEKAVIYGQHMLNVYQRSFQNK